jgi:hypothetical protein
MKPLAGLLPGVLALFAFAGIASGALRSPQVPVPSGGLQGFLDSRDGGINVQADQRAEQSWSGGTADLTLEIDLTRTSPGNAIGLYHAGPSLPTPYEVFPGTATAGWSAVVTFRSAPTRAVVTRFDSTYAFQGSITYPGADPTDFGFYLAGSGGTFVTQDALNPGGAAQVLAYGGTGVHLGSVWLCFEDQSQSPGGGGDSSFDDAVLLFQVVVFDPVSPTTWGRLKARFR